MVLVYFIISLIASIVGAICGIGGGVIIKPTLDIFKLGSVATISFLSGCTVFSMSLYTVSKGFISGDSKVDMKAAVPMAIGAAVGGIVGKQMFDSVRLMFSNSNTVGAVQSICLLVITFGTLLFTVRKDNIKTHRVENKFVCIFIGLLLGVMSSFLGIGGGPINLVVLFFFFSMDTKTASQNSIYIILISQLTSLFFTILTKKVPSFQTVDLALMIAGGIMGGAIGRKCNKRMNNEAVDKLFVGLMIVIMLFCAYNGYHYIFNKV